MRSYGPGYVQVVYMFPNLILLYWQIFLTPEFPLVSGTLLKANHTSEDQGGKCTEYLSLLYAFFHQVPCPMKRWTHISPHFPFVANITVQSLLFALYILPQIKFQMNLSLLTSGCGSFWFFCCLQSLSCSHPPTLFTFWPDPPFPHLIWG